ncbi:TRP-like family [Penicillium griseofulvum]|uniref:TRP-like family n=1 Tax=Penicillium patulum TaxID=5078 RepID=A0A135LVV4_PENPA|nr:TRP-like family [Penicillium griseofulvum]KXG53086.1 TRP-like family [Penicillium griseofulvum]
MRLISLLTCFVAFLAPLASAVQLLESNALSVCMESSNFTATYFSVIFYPANNSLVVGFDGVSYIEGKVVAEMTLTAYGFEAYKHELNPCKIEGMGMCPMAAGPMDLGPLSLDLPADTSKNVPGIAYTVPDLDANVRIVIKTADTLEKIACVQASLSNGKTVNQAGVSWTTAVISGLGLAASAITSGLGHSNTAAHVAANALSLFGFMQSQAIIGMTSVHMPPIVEAWTQNFQWSMGIIRVGFIQKIATWYQRATGGTPSTILSQLGDTSVEVLKRRKRDFVDPAIDLLKRAAGPMIVKRASGLIKRSETSQKLLVIRGIERVGFRANMEETNIFLTGLIFFSVFTCIVVIIVAAFKGITELLVRHGKMKSDRFQDFRNGWKIVLRGILFRLTLIGFPQMTVLCLWEFTQRDSAAEVVLAAVMLLSMLVSLGWASQKVIRLAKRSVTMHKNPAYILYSDPSCLNKWGFLYVQYRATAYYFVVPFLVYTLIKGMFIGLSQPAPIVQTVALVILELAMLVAVCILRPWMDKKTNVFNISIAVINFINSIFVLVFSDVFDPPGLMIGVMGVIFFVYNCIFAFVLLILVLIASVYAVVSKNPDTRYQPMRDDRGSFIKSQTQLTTELDALGATARGDMKPGQYNNNSPFDDDTASISSGNGATVGRQMESTYPPHGSAAQAPRSPVDPSVPLFPSNAPGHHNTPGYDHFGRAPSPAGRGFDNNAPIGQSALSAATYRTQNSASPWQRGAGYDH